MNNSLLINVRRIGALIVATAAVLVALTAGPENPVENRDTNYAALLDAARAEYDLNNSRTSGAPQQQVVNGWFARDALTLQVRQLSDLLDNTGSQAPDPRLPLLGLFAVLAICLYAATSPPMQQAARHHVGNSSSVAGEANSDDASASPASALHTGATSTPVATPPPPLDPPSSPPLPPPGT